MTPLEDPADPGEPTCDVVWVDASSKREAIRRGVPQMPRWPRYQREGNANPYSGVWAERPVCEHGVCLCRACFDATDGPICPERCDMWDAATAGTV